MESSREVAIVTGANSGIGLGVTKQLCELGYQVVMACRSSERAQEAIKEIQATCPKADPTYMQLDLSDYQSVRDFVKDFHQKKWNLDLLVNNGGICHGTNDATRHVTSQGHEETMATNHLGHFLLTNLLLEDLKTTAEKAGQARVVVVASGLHDPQTLAGRQELAPLDLDDLMLEKPKAYSSVQAYKNSKLANVTFTIDLARRLQGTNVTVNCLCPGFIPSTGLIRQSGFFLRFFLRYILDGAMKLFKNTVTRSLEEGVTDVIYLATSPKVQGVSGKYYRRNEETTPSAEAQDADLRNKMWELSSKLVNLQESSAST